MKTILLFAGLFFFSPTIFSQNECGTNMSEYGRMVSNSNSEVRNINLDDIHSVPIVVHIICHNNEMNNSIFCNSTIEEARGAVLAQISFLNKAFRNESPRQGNLSSEFQDISADAKIQFALATTDPVGLATLGLNRIYPSHPEEYVVGQDSEMVKETSAGGITGWPREKYLNIWICDLNIGGYCPPIGSTDPSSPEGAVIDFERFNSEGTTIAHELGHFFWLWHTFGDCVMVDHDNDSDTDKIMLPCCDCDDGIQDTPLQRLPSPRTPPNGNHWNAPCQITGTLINYGGEQYSCSNTTGTPGGALSSCLSNFLEITDLQQGIMYQNYMDYSNNKCRSMFSQGQVNWMRFHLYQQGVSHLDNFGDYQWNYETYRDLQKLVPTLTYGVPKIMDFSNALPTINNDPTLPTCDGDVKLCVYAEFVVPPSGNVIVIYDKVNGSLISDVGSEITYTDASGNPQTHCDQNSYDPGDVTNSTAPYMPYYRVDDMEPGSTARIRTWDYTNYTTDDADIDEFSVRIEEIEGTVPSGTPNLKPFTSGGSQITHSVNQGTNDASISLTVDIINDGDGPNQSPFIVQVYLSANETLEYEGSWNGNADRLIASKVVSSALQPGNRNQVNFTIPSLKALGYDQKNKRNIVVSIDVFGDVPELDENDNDYVFANALEKNPTNGGSVSLPDLTVLTLRPQSEEVIPGGNLWATAKIKNQSGVEFSTNRELLFNYTLSENNRCGYADIHLAQEEYDVALLQKKKPVDGLTYILEMPNDLIVGRPYWLCGKIDISNEVNEGINEGGSNCRCHEIAVVNQLVSNNNFRIQTSPNPARDYTTVISSEIFDEDSLIELVSLNGQVVSRERPNSGEFIHEIKTDGLEGVFIIVVRTKGKLGTQKLVIVK